MRRLPNPFANAEMVCSGDGVLCRGVAKNAAKTFLIDLCPIAPQQLRWKVIPVLASLLLSQMTLKLVLHEL